MNSLNERLWLKWANFNENVSLAFGERRKDMVFSDVTLVCEDGQQMEAHKVILASASPFFLELLKKNQHPHPLIYMKEVKAEELTVLIDFLYFGEASIYQENLDSFLATVKELKVRGLSENPGAKEEEHLIASPSTETIQKTKEEPIDQVVLNQEEETVETVETKSFAKVSETTTKEETLAISDHGNDALDAQILLMVEVTDVSLGGNNGRKVVCTLCGKEGRRLDIFRHVEANHITGLSHSCTVCGKPYKTRDTLRLHMRKHKV